MTTIYKIIDTISINKEGQVLKLKPELSISDLSQHAEIDGVMFDIFPVYLKNGLSISIKSKEDITGKELKFLS